MEDAFFAAVKNSPLVILMGVIIKSLWSRYNDMQDKYLSRVEEQQIEHYKTLATIQVLLEKMDSKLLEPHELKQIITKAQKT